MILLLLIQMLLRDTRSLIIERSLLSLEMVKHRIGSWVIVQEEMVQSIQCVIGWEQQTTIHLRS